MMTATLNDLFDQIIHSERRAEERKNRLIEVKRKIGKCREKLVTTREERESCRGRQVLKVQQLSEEENKLHLFTNHEAVLKEQIEEAIKEKKDLEDRVEKADEEYDDMLDKFTNDINEFVSDNDLSSVRYERRERELQEKLEILVKKEKEISKDVEKYDEHTAEINKLKEEKRHIEENISILLTDQADIDCQLVLEMEMVNDLEKQRKELSEIPQKDSEFCRLRLELKHLMSHDLEAEAQKLQEELKKLQDILKRSQTIKEHSQKQMPDCDGNSDSSICPRQPLLEQNKLNETSSVSLQSVRSLSQTDCDLNENAMPSRYTSNRLRLTSYSSPTLRNQKHLPETVMLTEEKKARITPRAIFKPKKKK